jgi:hypothetical protein
LAIRAFEDRAREGLNPIGDILTTFVEGIRSATAGLMPVDRGTGTQPWQSFVDVVALNEALDTQEFVSEWWSVRERARNVVEVRGTLYPFEPICAGSAKMWRDYWVEMQGVLEARLGPASGRLLDRKEKARDWWTHSLFLWGFSMARDPQPDGNRWLGLASMDEINAIPVLMAPAAWERLVSSLFAGRERAWEVRLTGSLERRGPASATLGGKLQEVFRLLERPFYLAIHSPDQVIVQEKSVDFSAYIWALFETPAGNKFGLWEHANIADHELFEDGVARLAAKVRDFCEPKVRLVASLAPDVAAALCSGTP